MVRAKKERDDVPKQLKERVLTFDDRDREILRIIIVDEALPYVVP